MANVSRRSFVAAAGSAVATLAGLGACSGGSSTATTDAAGASTEQAQGANLMGEVLGDHVIELPTITQIDYEAGLKKNKELFGGFGCSCIAKVLDDGDTIVGRSMDLNFSNNPAYVIRTAVEGFYKTVGFSYNIYDGHTFDDVKQNGVTQDELLTLLFFTEDVMNEKGLYIEGNMRPRQASGSGIASTTGTNPDAEVSMSFPAAVRYLDERCATVEEAVELANTLNLYGMKCDEGVWGGGLLIADASGHFGVLELIDNKVIWTDGQNCQTNFYVNGEYKDRAIIGNGTGRYDLLQAQIGSVKSEADMTALMKKVRYTLIYDPYNCPFDPCSEHSGEGEEKHKDFGGILTMEMCADEKYSGEIYSRMEECGAAERAKSLQQRRDEGIDWISVWQTTANCNKRSLTTVFFEDDALAFDFAV